jgi:predicted dehydrogenase
MQIRIAVVGAGHLGRIHARILASLPQFVLQAVVDPVESQRRQVAAEFHTTAFAEVTDVLDHVDAVVIAAPTTYHHAVASQCLSRGKHVFVEKPLTLERREADALVRSASQQRVALQVGHVERFNPAFIAAQSHLRQPKFIQATRRGGYTFRSTDIGVVLDLMIHDIDLVLSLAPGEPTRVDAMGVALFGQHEDMAQARIEFENGCVANLNACRASHSAERTMQVWTAEGFASLDFQQKTASVVRPSAALRDRTLRLDQLSPAEKQAMRERLMGDHLPIESLQVEPADAITAELLDFAESIRTGRSPQVSGQAGRDAVALAERILDKIATHAWNGVQPGPVGPLFETAPAIIPAPHWQLKPAATHRLREAG